MSSSESVVSWIQWFCSLPGNEFFCEIDEDYIADQFNLCGLNEYVPDIKAAIDKVLDYENDESEHDSLTDAEQEKNAALLYGMVHARYILTNKGLAQMVEKWNDREFGTCPRVFCEDHPLLPMGLSETPAVSTVKMFCTKCGDIFVPRKIRHQTIDGAYFGCSFPEMMLMVYPQYREKINPKRFEPRLYGFKIHPSALQRGDD